jgi:hypothetical protein
MQAYPPAACLPGCLPACLQTGKCLLEKQVHEKHIMDLQMSNDLTHFVTASNDKSAKLIDTQVGRRGGAQALQGCRLQAGSLGGLRVRVRVRVRVRPGV